LALSKSNTGSLPLRGFLPVMTVTAGYYVIKSEQLLHSLLLLNASTYYTAH